MPQRRALAAVQFAISLHSMRKPDEMLAALDQMLKPMGLFVLDLFWLAPNYHEPQSYRLDGTWFLSKAIVQSFWDEFFDFLQQHGPSFYVRYARIRRAPFTFNEATHAMNPNGGQRWIIDHFRKHKINDGYFYPANNNWILALGAHKMLRLTEIEREALNYAAGALTQRIDVFMRRKHKPPLSARQYAVLERYAGGEEIREIAHQMHMTADSVKEHLRRARQKLGAKNSTHAAVMLVNLPAPK